MIKWEIYKRGSIPLHVLEPAVVGYQKYAKKYFGDNFNKLIYFSDMEIGSFIYGKEVISTLGDLIIDKITRNSQKEFYNNWRKIIKNLQDISFKIIKTDLNKINNAQKLVYYSKIVAAMEQFHAYAAISVDLTDTIIEEKINQLFNKVTPKRLNNSKNLNILKSVTSFSFVLEKEKQLLEISLTDKDKISEFQKKYFWINFGWQKQQIYTGNDIIRDLKNINRIEIKRNISKMESEFRQIKLGKKKLLKKIDNEELNNLIDFSDSLMFYHDDRKKNQMISLYAINKILKSIKEFKFTDLLWLTNNEVKKIISTGQAIDYQSNKPVDFDERRQGFMVTLFNQKIFYQYGLQTRKKFDQIVQENIGYNNSEEIEGVPSCGGKVKGRVRVIFDPGVDLKSINESDILVAPMTTPDFVPIMKKVSAIVTDEGGITCHAAIVAREMNKPCITGTKIATRVLADGDLIEVNADKGLIKILKKEK